MGFVTRSTRAIASASAAAMAAVAAEATARQNAISAEAAARALADATSPPQYMSTADVTIANTTSELTTLCVAPNFVGSKTIPANRAIPSTTISISGGGVFSIPLVTPGNATVKVKLGGTVIASSTITGLTGALTNAAFQFDCALVYRTIGASGTVAPVGGLNFAGPAGTRVFSDLLNGGSDVTINTTLDQALDVTFQWATASASRSITVRGCIVTLVN